MNPRNKSNFFVNHSVVAASDHYKVLRNHDADPFTPNADFLLVGKEYDNIEARHASFLVISMYLRDAEASYEEQFSQEVPVDTVVPPSYN